MDMMNYLRYGNIRIENDETAEHLFVSFFVAHTFIFLLKDLCLERHKLILKKEWLRGYD